MISRLLVVAVFGEHGETNNAMPEFSIVGFGSVEEDGEANNAVPHILKKIGVAMPMPHIAKEILEEIMESPQQRFSERVREQRVDVPVQVVKEIMTVPKAAIRNAQERDCGVGRCFSLGFVCPIPGPDTQRRPSKHFLRKQFCLCSFRVKLHGMTFLVDALTLSYRIVSFVFASQETRRGAS